MPVIFHSLLTKWTLRTRYLLDAKPFLAKLGQTYTVITFDQALYCKAKEVVWCNKDEFENVMIRLGGFQTSMNFHEGYWPNIWILRGYGMFGLRMVSMVNLAHASVAMPLKRHAVRAHKLTFEAL